MSWLFIEPSDVWLFRDGRPFTAGEGHAAETLYPPPPFTVQGALRSWLLGRELVDWRTFLDQSDTAAQNMATKIGHPPREGVAGSLGAFAMRGPFRARLTGGRAEILYPAPLDVHHVRDRGWRALRPVKTNAQMNWDEGFCPLLPDPRDTTEKPDEESSGTLTYGSLMDYLEGRLFGLLGRPEVEREQRLGIAMDYGPGRAADGMLYLAEFARLRPSTDYERYGLLVEATDALTWPNEAVISMGGEMRAALVRTLTAAEAPVTLPALSPGLRFKIVLLTPAWFASGRQPENGDWAIFFKAPADVKVNCIAAAVGRPQFLGGWDAARGKHKPLRGFVPPGSVFYFETNEPVELPDAFTQTPDGELNFPAQGFGAFVAGSWEWLNQTP